MSALQASTQTSTAVLSTPVLRIAEPELRIRAERTEVKLHEHLEVSIELQNLDQVDLKVVPARAFSLETITVTESGLVRLRGEWDGVATLIVRGTNGTNTVTRMIHLHCEGPQLRLLGFGYLAPKG